MCKAEAMETLLDICITWALGQEYYAKLRAVHHQLLLRAIGFIHRQRSIYLLLCSKALKTTQGKNVDTTIRKRRLLYAAGVVRQHDGHLPNRVIFGVAQ